MTEHNDTLFDRYDALTFNDVVVIPGYSETLPDAVDTSAVFAAGRCILIAPRSAMVRSSCRKPGFKRPLGPDGS